MSMSSSPRPKPGKLPSPAFSFWLVTNTVRAIINWEIVVGANRLPKYWINFLLLSTALHYSALGPQNLGDSGRWRWNAM
jgi:hypothetical protein